MRFAATAILVSCLAGCGGARARHLAALPEDASGSTATSVPSSVPSSADSATTEPTTHPTTEAAATQPAPAGYVLPEGTMVIDRTGRLIHSAKGEPEIAFDPDGKGANDSPMLLLKNLELEQMEDAAAADPNMKFKVTGIITGYLGHDYLLLTKVAPLAEAESNNFFEGRR